MKVLLGIMLALMQIGGLVVGGLGVFGLALLGDYDEQRRAAEPHEVLIEARVVDASPGEGEPTAYTNRITVEFDKPGNQPYRGTQYMPRDTFSRYKSATPENPVKSTVRFNKESGSWRMADNAPMPNEEIDYEILRSLLFAIAGLGSFGLATVIGKKLDLEVIGFSLRLRKRS